MPEALTDTPRILNKVVDGFIGASSGSVLNFGAFRGEGWDIIPAQENGSQMFRWRGYIDLGGLEREALTFFLQSAQVVEATDILASGIKVDIMDVFSKVEISDNDLNLPTHIQNLYSPGFNDSVQDMDQVLWCRSRNYYHDSGWSQIDMQQISNQQIWGEGIGTSASRIHLTRYVSVGGDEPKITVPPCVFQCVGTAIEEPDLNYIMRLRRDYELATQG
jgi:hypothetical protein